MNDLAVSTSIPRLEADPFDLSNILDPYDFHEQLRETGAVTYVEKYDSYAVGRYAEVREVLSDWETFTSTAGAGLSDIRRPGGGDNKTRLKCSLRVLSRPRSWRFFPSLASFRSTTFCVAMPAWSVPGIHSAL